MSNTKYSEYIKEQNNMDELYTLYQRKTGLPDAEFWSIFAIYNKGCIYQHEICQFMCMNKQTINAALKHLGKKGLIKMVIPPDNQRIRKVELTEDGLDFAHKYLDYIDEVEQRAWDTLEEKEQDILLASMRKINQIFKESFENIK